MAFIQNGLIVRIRMNRRHKPAHDAEFFLNDLRDRRQAIRRAGRIGNNRVARRIVVRMIHADDERRIIVLSGRRDDDFLHAAVHVLHRFLMPFEFPRRLDDNLRPVIFPCERRRVAALEDMHAAPLNHEIIAVNLNVPIPAPVDGIVFQKIRRRLHTARIIDRDDVKFILPIPHIAENQPPDAPKPIDPNLRSHPEPSCKKLKNVNENAKNTFAFSHFYTKSRGRFPAELLSFCVPGSAEFRKQLRKTEALCAIFPNVYHRK